jgi:hypothetical protein
MKLSRKNRGSFGLLVALCALIGSLAWEVLERLLALLGREVALSIGPLGIDLVVVSFSLLINPGTFIGLLGGVLIFRTI